MTRKNTRSTSVLRGIAPFIAVLIVMIALAALAQTRGAGQALGKSHAGDAAVPSTVGPMGPVPPFFLPAVAYDSGGNDQGGAFRAVAVADLNGDGKRDLVVANHTSNTVGVLLGNGDGTFQPVATFNPGGQSPSAIAIAAVLLGNGDGTFQSAVIVSSNPGGGNDVAVADVNRDGIPDVIFGTGCGAGCVGVLLGNGDGTFQPAATYGTGTVYAPASVAVADVNGDGKLDLLTANFQANTVSVLLGKGDGTFNPAVTYGSGGFQANSIAVADVNGDHKPDLVVANCGTNKCAEEGFVAVLLGNGDGTFQPAVTYDSGGQAAFGVATADVDGDGKPDMLAANAFSNTVGLLLGNGDGTFRSALTYSSGGLVPAPVVVADLNGDGRPDLVVENECVNWTCSSGNLGVLLHVGSTPTKTLLASSLNPSVFGQVVTLTAMVSSSSGTPTGTVVFFDGSATLGSTTLVSGTASMPVSALGAGSHSIIAVYQGSLKFNSSASAPLTQVVNSATTTTSLASSHNPWYVNQTVKYTATVTSQYGGAATGTVIFQDGGTTVATKTVASNRAVYSTKYSSPGAHSITATYSGDTNNAGSLSSTLVEQIYQGFASTTVLTTSGSPSFVGQSVTFTATVTSSHGAIPDGELVAFYDGTTAIGTGGTASGVATFTTSSLKAKTHTIKATYPGDTTFMPSSGTVTQVVNKYTTTTTLTSSPNPSQFGQAVTFTAHVTSTGPAPTGSVKFLDGTTGIGLVTLNGGVAKLTKSTLAVGTHPITAQYLGDAASAKSTSPVVNQVVQ